MSAATVVLAQPLLALPRWRRLDDPIAIALGFVVLAAGLALTGLATSLAAYVATRRLEHRRRADDGPRLRLGLAVAPAMPAVVLRGVRHELGLRRVIAPLAGTQLLDRFGPEATWVVGRRLPGARRGVRSRTWTPRPRGTWRR